MSPDAPSAEVRCATTLSDAAAVADLDGRARIRFLRKSLNDDAAQAATWTGGWMIVGGFLSVSNLLLATVEGTPRTRRMEHVVAGAAALHIPAALFVRPLYVLRDASAYRDATAENGSLCALVARGEAYLARAAREERLRRRFTANLSASAIGVTSFVLVAFVLDDWPAALVGAAGAVAVQLARSWTAPDAAAEALDRYRRGDLEARSAAHAPASGLKLVPAPGGAALAFHF